jgi:LmbE family N-acetylglucosaminyl deacetylase
MDMNILIIAPHPDDEVLGCGGTIAKYKGKNDKIYLCIVTKAYTPDWSEEFLKNRPNEIAKSNKILGIHRTFFLDYPTVKLDTIPQKELNDSISKIIHTVKPQIVYIPFKGDLNKDHQIVCETSLVALRPHDHKVQKILSYEILSNTEWGGMPESFVPTVYVDITDTFTIKIEAMKAYKSELRTFPHPRSLQGIEILARKRGSEAGVKYAEAYKLIREFCE